MQDYESVTKALANGADPAMLCATCPWDRNCLNPPEMTRAEITRKIGEAAAEDRVAMSAARLAGDPTALPTATLMTAAIYGGKDTALQGCPVLGVRLRSADGRRLADAVRTLMQGWADS